MFNHAQTYWIILNSSLISKGESSTVHLNHLTYRSIVVCALLLVGSSTELKQFLCSPCRSASKYVSIHCLCRVKTINCVWFLSKDKSQVCEEGWHCGAPQNPLQTPRKEPRLKLLWRVEMPACLIEALLLHIHVWISGEDSLIKHSKKSNSKRQKPSFLYMGTCLMFAGVHCHEK